MQATATPVITTQQHITSEELQLDLFTDEEVFEVLQDQVFKAQWEGLYESCVWATAFQSFDYASIWYTLNKQRYVPVLVRATRHGNLVGILPMALFRYGSKDSSMRNNRERIMGVGHNEAEYHTWLSVPEMGSTFVTAAIKLLLDRYPKHDVGFRYIPHQAPVEWATQDPYWKPRCVLQASSRPLMKMNDPEVFKLFKKRGFKLKLNRLKRLGELNFEHVTDSQRFLSLIDTLTTQYDFRQGAMFNRNQFRKKPEQRELLVQMFEKDLLHVTALTLNDEVIASIIGVTGKNWVHLGGTNSHSSIYAAHSPGFLHFLLLGQLLASESTDMVFDLTPGGDAYKERMATGHDAVHELIVTNSTGYILRRACRKWLHTYLHKAGMRPDVLVTAMKRHQYMLKHKGLASFIKSVAGKKVEPKHTLLCLEQNGSGFNNPEVQLKKNNLTDLLDYEFKKGELTRWEFLETAMAEFERGGQCYTLAQGRKLLACAWLKTTDESTENESDTGNTAGSDLPEGVCLYNMYRHPGFAGNLTDFVAGITHAAKLEAGEKQVYAKVESRNKKLLDAFHQTGYTSK